MARKVFISVLGTNSYLETRYYFGKKPNGDEKVTRFIQEATMEHLCWDWGKNDIAYIFVTEDAKKLNWNDPAQKNKKETYKGLSKVIEQMSFEFDTEPVDIADGLSEDEIWDIFTIVFEKLEDGDELYFDITHSFRSIPMLVMVLINYAKFLKNVKVKRILYGAFEKLGPAKEVANIPVEKRFAPVLDLTAFSELQDWTSAAHSFIKYGSALEMAEMIENNEIKRLLIEFTDNHYVVRGKELYSGEIADKLYKLIDNKIYNLPAFKHIEQKLKEKITQYNTDIINNGLVSIKYCIDHNLIQQGFTLLDEFIITYVLLVINYDWENEIYRDTASSCLNVSRKESFEIKYFNMKLKGLVNSGKINEEERKKYLDNVNKIVEKLYQLPYIKKLSAIMMSVSHGSRNDINHAGIREKPRTSDKFKESLKKHFENFKKIVENNV